MSVKTMIACLAAALVLSWAGPCVAAEEGVDKAFEVLKTYDWGTDRDLLKAIDDAVVASHKDAAARKELEARLAAVLKTDASRAAKDYVCRKLSLIGTAASVPALAALLPDENLSHMARYALERMPCKEAVAAMRDALPKVKGRVKVGVINSLGVRRDAESLPAAVAALGSVGNLEAAKALGAFRAPEALKLAAADAQLTCGERLLADGKKDEAELVYKRLLKLDQPKHVRVAATLGLLAVKGAK
jgi:hypothetical protein